jgi:hypothetical protein
MSERSKKGWNAHNLSSWAKTFSRTLYPSIRLTNLDVGNEATCFGFSISYCNK